MSRGEFVCVSHGMLGYGFPEESLAAAVEIGIDLIAVDAGSTDPGPHYLGSAELFGDPEMIRRDLGLLLQAQEASGAKMVIGSAGGGGTDRHIEQTMEILRGEVVRRGWRRKVAIVRSELTKDEVRSALLAGSIRTFESGIALTDEAIDESTHIVAQIGVEPIIAAMAADPDIVLCGRAWDPANIAALPIARGFDAGLSIHAGKILECGALAASPPQGADLLLARIGKTDFVVEPCDGAKRCTVESVSAHMFYEKIDPVRLPGPGGWSDLRRTKFEQIDPRRVRVSGSRFVADETYRIKLEGARLTGWRTVMIGGIRDPIMIAQIDGIQAAVAARAEELLRGRVHAEMYRIFFRRYGRDGVMGRLEPRVEPSHEIGLLVEVVAATEAISRTVMSTLRSLIMHWAYPGRKSTSGNLALPFSPAELYAGPVYEFSIYHLLAMENSADRFRYEIEVVQ